MGKRIIDIVPEYKPITDFLRGKASIIFREVADKDKVLIVNRNSKPQNVIISYKRYTELLKQEKRDNNG